MKWIKIVIVIAIILQNQEITGFLGSTNDNICDSVALLSGLININDSPIPIEIEVPEKVVSGSVIDIKIKNIRDVKFSAFAIQAISYDDSIIGKFIPNIEVNKTDCHGIFNSAAIYNNFPSNNEMVIEWHSPFIEEAIDFKFL